MRFFLVLLICLGASGCLGLFSGSKQDISKDTVERYVNVSSDKLFRAAVVEFRNISIIDSSQDLLYIKGIYEGILIEFNAWPEADERTSFTLKASTLSGSPRYDIAEKFANLIHKRAKSIWFSFIGFKAED